MLNYTIHQTTPFVALSVIVNTVVACLAKFEATPSSSSLLLCLSVMIVSRHCGRAVCFSVQAVIYYRHCWFLMKSPACHSLHHSFITGIVTESSCVFVHIHRSLATLRGSSVGSRSALMNTFEPIAKGLIDSWQGKIEQRVEVRGISGGNVIKATRTDIPRHPHTPWSCRLPGDRDRQLHLAERQGAQHIETLPPAAHRISKQLDILTVQILPTPPHRRSIEKVDLSRYRLRPCLQVTGIWQCPPLEVGMLTLIAKNLWSDRSEIGLTNTTRTSITESMPDSMPRELRSYLLQRATTQLLKTTSSHALWVQAAPR